MAVPPGRTLADRYGEQGREALVQSTNRLLLEHVIRYRLYGSVGSLGLVLRRCEKQRLELLYTVVKDTELLPPWDESRLIKEIEHAIVPPRRRFLHPKGLYDEQLAAFKDMSVDEIIVTLLDSVHARLREVPFEELLGYFANHNAPAVYAFMIDCDKLVESIQERVEKDSDLKLLFESTVKVLQTREEPVAAFLGEIIDFAIDSSQKANFLRRHLQALREDERGPRLTIKRSLVPECTVQSSHMNALKSELLDKKPDDLKSFIAEILIKESQFARDEMTPSTDTLRWVCRTKPRRFNESLTCPINEPDAAKEGSKFTPINEPNAAEEGSKFIPINEPGAAEEGSKFIPINEPGAAEEGSKFIPINEPGAAEEGSNATEFDSGVVVEESFGGDTKDGAVAKKL